MFEVVWVESAEYECSYDFRLGLFPTEEEATAFARPFMPPDATDPNAGWIAVGDITTVDGVGPSAKWLVRKFLDAVLKPGRWESVCSMVCPTGDEVIEATAYPDWYEMTIYAPTRAAAIARFEAHFGVRFEDEGA